VKLFLISAPKQQNLGAKKFDRPPRFTGNSAALPTRPDTYGSEDVRVSDGTSFETRATTKLATKTDLPIPKSVESNLKNLMRLYPNGLPVMKLARLYEVRLTPPETLLHTKQQKRGSQTPINSGTARISL